MKIRKKLAKSISYDAKKKRSRSSVKYIVIHYTGNKGDTAKANASYFATSNARQAGAHFFVDKKGDVYKSVNMNRTACRRKILLIRWSRILLWQMHKCKLRIYRAL